MVEYAVKCLGQYNTRHLLVPPANGVDYRIHNGYLYMSPMAVAPEKIPARVPHFLERAGFYFQNWNTLLENWHVKVRKVIDALEALRLNRFRTWCQKNGSWKGAASTTPYYLIESYESAPSSCATRLGNIISSFSISVTRPI